MKAFDESRWQALWTTVSARAVRACSFKDLLARYSEPQRHYHNAQHIDECLREFDLVRAQALDPAALEFAIWFHDVIYDPRASDNEEQSARFATESLKGARDDLDARVSDLVLTTKTHLPGSIPDAALLIDIDLSILGKPAKRFDEYEAAIREEYSWVSISVYCEKRAAILRAFLQRDRIFTTQFFHDRYEFHARQNLANSVAKLSQQAKSER